MPLHELWLGRQPLTNIAEDVTLDMICNLIAMACAAAWEEGL